MIIVKKKIPIFTGKLVIVINDDFEESVKAVGLDLPGWNLAHYGALASDGRSKKGFPRYYGFFRHNADQSLIAHETVHLVNFLFDQTHIKLDLINDEVQAYLTGWFIKQINKAFKKKKKNGRK